MSEDSKQDSSPPAVRPPDPESKWNWALIHSIIAIVFFIFVATTFAFEIGTTPEPKEITLQTWALAMLGLAGWMCFGYSAGRAKTKQECNEQRTVYAMIEDGELSKTAAMAQGYMEKGIAARDEAQQIQKDIIERVNKMRSDSNDRLQDMLNRVSGMNTPDDKKAKKDEDHA